MRPLLALIAIFVATPAAAADKTELSFYGGLQSTADSRVYGSEPNGIGPFDFLSYWRNQTNSLPAQYGIRVTWWQTQNRGWGIDFNSSAVRVDEHILNGNGPNELELSNGINLLTVNTYRKFKGIRDLQPYVGAGIGVSIPRVEFDSGAGRSSQYQLTGPSIQFLAGATLPLRDNLSVFGEYSGSYTVNNADIGGGGSFKTITQNGGLNVGVSLGF